MINDDNEYPGIEVHEWLFFLTENEYVITGFYHQSNVIL